MILKMQSKRRDLAADSASAWLSALGYSVQRVPEGIRKSCDLRADHVTGPLWVECKRDRLSEDQRRDFGLKGKIEVVEPLESHKKTHAHASQAAKQLDSSAPEQDLKVLWIEIEGPGTVPRSARAHCTLFGVRWFKIMSGPARTLANVVPVYLGSRSVFKDHPHIDAAVLKSPGNTALYPNPFSGSFQQLRASRFFEVLQRCGGVFDLDAAQEDPELYAVDKTVNSESTAAVIDDLKRRYEIEAVPLPMTAGFLCSPEHETGECPFVPGADIAALDINMLLCAGNAPTSSPREPPP